MNRELTGTHKALLDEYKKAIAELTAVIGPLTADEIVSVRDEKTNDPQCRSIQTILTHVIHSGFGYINYIEKHLGDTKERPPGKYFDTASEYIDQLNRMFEYSETFFIQNPEIPLEEIDPAKKVVTGWDQQYDIEQLIEHAIVHVLKHRRQIQNFLR